MIIDKNIIILEEFKMKNLSKKWAFAAIALATSAALTACAEQSNKQEDTLSAAVETYENTTDEETVTTEAETTTTETSVVSAAGISTATPDFIGLTEEEAVNFCEENNYEYIIEHRCIENIDDTIGVVANQDVILNRVNNGNAIIQEATYVLTIYEEFTPTDIPERSSKFQLESYSTVVGDMGIFLIEKEYSYDESGHIVKIENYYGTGTYKSGNETVYEIAEFNISYNPNYSEITMECKSSYLDQYYKECWENGKDLSEKYKMPNPDEFPDEPINFYFKNNTFLKNGGDLFEDIVNSFHTSASAEPKERHFFIEKPIPYVVFYDENINHDDNIEMVNDSYGNLAEAFYLEYGNDKFTYKEFDTPLDKSTVYLNCYVAMAVSNIV